jgi:uncharacterized protein (TIGR02453 family)
MPAPSYARSAPTSSPIRGRPAVRCSGSIATCDSPRTRARTRRTPGAHFQLGGKGVHGPGYYLHLEPGECFVAGGMWMPEPEVLQSIRQQIADEPAEWSKARGKLDHSEETLKRPPRGFDADHPMIEDIKRKSFTGSVRLTDKQVTSTTFMTTFVRDCERISPLMKFLASAAGVQW